ncbi:MAG: IS3 family transposase [Streptosporangiaceae bacterium]
MWRFEASPRRAAPKGLPSSFAQHRIPKGTYLHPVPLFLHSWHTDITYIPTWQGWLYLATVIDCHSKEVIGWATGDNYKTPLIEKAIEMAVCNHSLAWNAIFHSDRGSNYTSRQFATTLKRHNIRQSVGRTGICYDNAMAESFFAALKNERVHRTQYPTQEHARRDVVRYIEFWYNSKRRHSRLQYRTPQQVRDEYLERQSAA